MARFSIFGSSNNETGANRTLDEKSLPIRSKEADGQDGVASAVSGEVPSLDIHPLATRDGMIVKIQPPQQPRDPRLHHVPCDIVLVIDLSGSMSAEAPVPSKPGEPQERNGLSVLDLTKHSAKTILETLNEHDRLGIVTFAHTAKIVQTLDPMNKENKKKTIKNIDSMKATGITNLWGGLLEGLKLFDKAGSNGRVPALMVLTDGVPNHMCPKQGYVPKLRKMELPATIHTFGFGYTLRSGLLKSIAEIGGGNYSFIPDAGMISTIFSHAVANLQSTFANNAVLRLTYPKYLKLEETTGESVDKQEPIKLDGDEPGTPMQLSISLSNLQYGQSRDIYLRFDNSVKDAIDYGFDIESPPIVTAELQYQQCTETEHMMQISRDVLDANSGLPPAEEAYHVSRSAIVSFLSALSPLRDDGEHAPLSTLPDNLLDRLQELITNLPAGRPEYATDAACRSLLEDLCGADPKGQISMALSNLTFYHRWGKHYLASLAGAHSRQICNSFKDPGPLMYGINSPLFIACRDRLDTAFDSLPAPKPSNIVGPYTSHIRMSSYNRSSNPCFAGCSTVVLAPSSTGKEGETIRIGRLRAGMRVHTPKGPRAVVAVLKTPVRQERMCAIDTSEDGRQLLVTPYHPIALDGKGTSWAFPKDVTQRYFRYTGSIYSILLQWDADPDAHAIMVGGAWGVTLGHGLVIKSEDPVRAHHFLGSYDAVVRSLATLHRGRGGLALGGGVRRDPKTGLVDGFQRASPGQIRKVMDVAARRRRAGLSA
ncbi:hint-domain-containing protein [Podospora didyma]|uniref:Hint-domain-containing protein n=1 Tax=Podospora didyma TaxID=330526 RepID=A0AAE0NI14_9PEZI|nr:hint-domain-containing protein [Podospora didyma]